MIPLSGALAQVRIFLQAAETHVPVDLFGDALHRQGTYWPRSARGNRTDSPVRICSCSAGSEAMAPTNHPLWFPLWESLGSFPHSLLSTGKHFIV